MATYETIELTRGNEWLTVTLNRPPLNLFSPLMMEELIDVWHGLRKDGRTRFVILNAAGKHFTAGFDLKSVDPNRYTPEDARLGQLAGHELMRSLENLEQVTVAALNGLVVGAGMAVAMACDFRIMADDANFLVPETMIGTYFTWGCTPRLVRMVGASKAMEIVMTCDPIPATEALRLNLANRVVPLENLQSAAEEFVAKLATRAPNCIRITKKIALGASMEGFGNMFLTEPELMQVAAYTGETETGVRAFLAGHPPDFTIADDN